jgi:hypothetical protein
MLAAHRGQHDAFPLFLLAERQRRAYEPKVETSSIDMLLRARAQGLPSQITQKVPLGLTKDQTKPIKEQKPPKESTTPSGPWGLHLTGVLARTPRKTNTSYLSKK